MKHLTVAPVFKLQGHTFADRWRVYSACIGERETYQGAMDYGETWGAPFTIKCAFVGG